MYWSINDINFNETFIIIKTFKISYKNNINYIMWLERLQKFQKENKQMLDLKFDLHLALYIQGLIGETINFQIDMKTNSLEIIMLEMSGEVETKGKEITKEEFYYWWQITKINEIFQE